MSFYLKPPRNRAFLFTIQSCVLARLNYFNCLSERNNSKNFTSDFEYLIADSAFDRIGHFTLRLLYQTSDLVLLKDIVIKKEKEVFYLRLSNFSSVTEFKKFLNTTVKHCDEAVDNFVTQPEVLQYHHIDFDSWHEFLNTLKTIIMELKTNTSYFFLNQSCSSCSVSTNASCEEYFKVPFKMCSSLVSTRQAIIKKGYVIFPYKKWKELLSELFEYHLYIAVKQANKLKHYHLLRSDRRFTDLINDAINILRINKREICDIDKNKSININNIKSMKMLFPPCMSNLYNKLTEHHRLTHDNRYQLTVFLKNIGMSFQDALVFWKSEYSKCFHKDSHCKCSWQQNGKRLIYSIRHMYGLEGRRANYRSHSCNYLQELRYGASSEGRCPFKYLSNDSLYKCLNKYYVYHKLNNKKTVFDSIFAIKNKNPSLACHILHSSIKEIVLNDKNDAVLKRNHHLTPVQYFSSLSSIINK
ncbi:uncharacterized protein LOC142329174 [Lycorma delicatula]|uniref:uncharacterized protein LOC142329174 n=1 Tax=Lycorma delicatula TaxID=130591 RepID=UPI003F51905D